LAIPYREVNPDTTQAFLDAAAKNAPPPRKHCRGSRWRWLALLAQTAMASADHPAVPSTALAGLNLPNQMGHTWRQV